MEDCCVVCAEPLEWVGYGPCGHRDVCSVCIARLRFVLGDKQCCICKQDCPSVYITKALGDYTKVVNDFENLAVRRDLWCDRNIEAYFDDEEHFKMIKSMCRLCCSVCEDVDSPGKDFVRKGHVFRNLNQLRRHLFNIHKVHMCGLCLEGRKVFICEQKLYTKKQLERHLQNGSSDVDLTDEDRGWFKGHPLCNFCHSRFYGDNELYQHMSTEHYTCHICQRSRPGQYDYYRNYDDLEIHFRHDHALCEHPDCLAQKFIVFSSDTELKRHNALTHGGNMSRAQRNAALQIPVSFQYRRPNQVNSRPLRRPEAYSEGRLQANSGLDNAIEHVNDEPVQVDSTEDFPHFQNVEAPSSATRTPGLDEVPSTSAEPSRYLTAVSGAGPSSLQNSAFPPLHTAFPALPGTESRQQIRGLPLSMASVVGDARRRSPLKINQNPLKTPSKGLPRNLPQAEDLNQWPQVSASKKSMTSAQVSAATRRPQADPQRGGHSDENNAENLRNFRLNFGDQITSSDNLGAEEVKAANKALRQNIHSVFQGDGDRYNEFKRISAQFRSGEMDAEAYLQHVKRFELLHLVPELARLCPDSRKKEDLLTVFRSYSNTHNNGFPELLASSGGSSQDEESEESKKLTLEGMSRLKVTDRDEGLSKENNVEVLSRDGYRDLKGKKSYYHAANGGSVQNKSAKVLVKARKSPELNTFRPVDYDNPISTEGILMCHVCTLERQEGSTHCAACGTPFLPRIKPGKYDGQSMEKGKRKKAIKLRMGDGSTGLLLDSRRKTWDRSDGASSFASVATGSGTGAWRNGGEQAPHSTLSRIQTEESISSGHRD